MKRILTLSSIALAFLLFSCSGSINTFSEYSKSIDFQKYKTYAWIPSASTDIQDLSTERMFGKMVTSIANEELKKKGMVLDTEHPDAVIRFSMGIKSQMEYSQSPTLSVGVGVGVGYGGYGYGMPGYYAGAMVPVAGGNITETRADEATLVFEMFETSTGYILWTGGARKTVDNNADTEKNVRLAMHSIFERLPIKHKIK
jgi:hypothetical protein